MPCETDRPGAQCQAPGTQLVKFGKGGRRDSRLMCPHHAHEEAAEHEGFWVGSGRPRLAR